MNIRSLREPDLAVVLRLWNDGAPHDVLTPELLAEKVLQDPDTDAICLVADTGQALPGFAMGVLRVVDGVCRGIVKLLVVDPAARRQGIGSALLQRLEAALSARGATLLRVAESPPNYLVAGVDARYDDGLAFFAARGYSQTGEAFNLVAELPGHDIQPSEPRGKGITLRRAGADDLAALRDFLRERWPTWDAEVMSAADNKPATLHVAWQGNELLGFAAHDANNRNTAWFGPMGVSEHARHSGVGCALLQRCLADMQRQGHRHAIIPWVDAIPFYEKCVGATLSRTFIRFEKAVSA